jgi:hypothetical protein
MRFAQWLFGRTPSKTDPVPQITLTAAALRHHADKIDIAATDSDELTTVSPADPGHNVTRYALDRYFSMIEYSDAAGQRSRRRVTMLHVDDNGRTMQLQAFCHERKAPRCFRLDRITCIITQDGEVLDADAWFAEILADADITQITGRAPQLLQTTKPAPLLSPYTALRREITPALTVLIASARSDDILHPKELDCILRFAEDEAVLLRDAGRLHGNPEADAFDKLERTIRRLRPTREDLQTAFTALAALDLNRQRHLAKALAETAAADGRVDDIEADLIEDMRATGTRHHGFGWDQ